MAKNNALNFNLPSADDLFSTEESRAEAHLEKVINLNPSEISDFPNHPFKVRMDAAMQEMTESVKQYGVLVPALVRPKPDGGYEMVAGHRRKKAAELANLTEIPCIVRQLTDDEATIIMVDSNLQREQILPSEKAFAYKMKLDAMKRQAGRPPKNNPAPLGPNLIGTRSNLELAAESPDSKTQIQRYIRLTNLIPEILELVDNSVLKDPETLQIALRPAVELSYLRKEEQADLFAIMDELDCTPSHAQAIKMRRLSEGKTGEERLSKDAMTVIMEEEKGNQKEQFKIPKERINKYFAPGTPAQKIEDTIIKALELYRKRQRSLER
ncbi:ParB/RepB/Spo0J family partition protein [[Clostridium] innocuum]|nr:ParB/RepB/Spo0J family partition protein [[Clostridium] innocuum]